MTDLIDMMAAEVSALEDRLKINLPHTCRFCVYYSCRVDVCRCHCGTIHSEIQARIDSLKALLDCARSGEIPVSVDAINEEAQLLSAPDLESV